MDPPFHCAKSIFLAAIEEHSSDQWAAFLDSACGGDAKLHARVEELLRAHVEMGEPAESRGVRSRTASSWHCCAPVPLADSAQDLPERVGRYRIERLLGKGGFGSVFLARDEQLDRPVAVKVPHANRVLRPEDAELYLAEARAVASLEHPHIVPVYDVGSTAEIPFFLVSKYVEGADLATKLKESRLSCQQAVEIVAAVAEALHYAHKQGLVHRDIKPGNILIGSNGTPYVVDFGLALREEKVGKGPRYAGTPPYMSPEQAGGEGHRVDGRSDVFGLGVVFYELLVGRLPFRGDTPLEILEQITIHEPRPPRQINDTIPRELERICLKALSKRATDRYTTAHDFSADLRHFLSDLVESQTPGLCSTSEQTTKETLVGSHTPSSTPGSHSPTIKIVPKGLRSFDAPDADFFLELLPGPRDRDALPDSIRFWKSRIEQADPDETFSVGLIYGPSGCGKSSLVKAGLLPRLAEHVLPVYVEATADETESRLLRGIRKRCPDLPNSLDLKETVAALRRGHGMPQGAKVLIVLDQFEQWLHAKRDEKSTELVQALRQCDGGKAQCLVMVRDDFWLAISRLMLALEVDLVPGHNISLIDVFDSDHARRVLAAFGRAFGKLPERSAETTEDQNGFLTQAISGLAEDSKVICVRLALFAEMMKGKPWTPTTLKEVGGTEGIGVTFLEETFSAATANPRHRLHQKAARAVLKSLLPEKGTDIKGNMRSSRELMEASGYSDPRKNFDDLIHILDSEIRLITPTDPEGNEPANDSNSKVEAGQKYYQLTHDYLVHSLREWLTRKQKETRRGRAELRLADRAAVWNAKPENRQLPSMWEFLNIRFLTDRRNWTAPQRKMMGKAGRVHGIRSSVIAAVLVVLGLSGVAVSRQIEEKRQADYAASLVAQIIAADIIEVPSIVQKLDGYRRWADPLLWQEDAQAAQGSNRKLHLSLALLPVDNSKIAELRDKLPLVSPSQFGIVRVALSRYKDSVVEPLWNVALDPKRKTPQRFQAACALATYAPNDLRWSQINTLVAGRLVTLEASALVAWREALRPAKARLIKPLASIYRDTAQDRRYRSYATETLADYAADRPAELFDLLADAELFQFPVLFDKLEGLKETVVALAHDEIGKQPSEKATEDQKERLAKRQANAAVALLRLGMPQDVWHVLKQSPDPRIRSYVIHWLGPLGADPQQIVQRLEIEPDVTIRRGLVLTLGEFTEMQLSDAQRQPLIEKLLLLYEREPDAGLHGAVEWLLRKWGQAKQMEAVVEKLKSDENQLLARKSNDNRQWYVNTQKQTFVIVDAGEFLMGSPQSEQDRLSNQRQHRRQIGSRFAISAHEITKAQHRTFQRAARPFSLVNYKNVYVRTDDSPQTGLSWYEAAHYCNWLSEQEGIRKEQCCFEPNEKGAYAPGMKAKETYLKLSGYRLPTEAEWEYACRAGTVTSRYYGLTDGLLPQYAWYVANSQNRTWPVGSLKPNDLGLFDMLGNALEWCFDVYADYPTQAAKVFDNVGATQSVEDRVARVLRGGGFFLPPVVVRSPSRDSGLPVYRNNSLGFRVARTYR
jgi:serine/threonine protein kinase/formylglycine-generating enzyme required for sulfatase activity